MIIMPQTPEEWRAATLFLSYHAGVVPSADMKIMGWVEDDALKMCVCFNGFLGRVCQIHVGMSEGYNFTPRKMLDAVFDYTFNQLGLLKLIGIVNSKNERAMKYDLHLGFIEEHRMVGMHEDEGDIVIFGMTADQCKYLLEKDAA